MLPSAPDINLNGPAIATTLDELLAQDDLAFIHCAYQTLLGRDPDSEGLIYYLARLRTGIPKMEILAQLRRSDEGKAHAANLPRLDAAIRRYCWTQNAFIGWLLRRFIRVESNKRMNMVSAVCTEKQLLSFEFQMWAKFYGRPGQLNRKAWDWCFISQALKEYDMLRPGKHGLGFAVGGEPLPAGFASFGASITATDLDYEEAAKKGWALSGQHCKNKIDLNALGLCSAETFDNLVHFDFCDMNNIPIKYYNKFDFVWSSCSLEHLGSMKQGAEFIYNSLRCLKKGGIAIHTTEFNVSSNIETISNENLYVFRKCDIETIIHHCHQQGYNISINWDFGTSFTDYHIDVPPYGSDPHLKLKFADFTITSIGLIITKP